MKPFIASVTALATSAGASIALVALASTPAANAADGTGVYAAWTLDGNTKGEGTFAETFFPDVALTTNDATVNTAKSAVLSGNTPFGEQYGSSRGQQYVTSALSSGKPQGEVTLTFASAPVAGTWGFVIGDLDAEDVKLSATDAEGNDVDVREWKYLPFNYTATGTDLPTWDEEANAIVGNGVDTEGASVWVEPTAKIQTLTITQLRRSGFPQYQLWIAADILTEPQITDAGTPDTVCTAIDTALVNGGFEFPVIPDKSFRQILQRDVPGWDTTATDSKIEIWSSGFNGVTAPEGKQFAELNATQPSELYQVVDTVPGETLTWSLQHRARAAGAAGDTMSVNIGPEGAAPNGVYTFTDTLTDGWVRHTGTYTVPDGQTRTRFGFESGATASGNKSIGNFLDDIYFTTTECIPAEAKEGNVVDPVIEPSASPSPSASGSESASPSATPSASPSGSASPSASVSASPSTSASPSPSVSPSASASPSASPSSSPSPTATSTSAVVEPTPTPAVTSSTPDRPTRIEPTDIPNVPSGSTITEVEQPTNGTAEVRDGEIIYTPDPGFIGEERISVTVVTPSGETQTTTVTVAVGKEQKIITRWKAPKTLTNGSNYFGPGTLMTNAMQPVKVSVKCELILRNISGNPAPKCSVIAGKEGTYINVKAYDPTAVIVTLNAPAKGKYRAFTQELVYRVNP